MLLATPTGKIFDTEQPVTIHNPFNPSELIPNCKLSGHIDSREDASMLEVWLPAIKEEDNFGKFLVNELYIIQ